MDFIKSRKLDAINNEPKKQMIKQTGSKKSFKLLGNTTNQPLIEKSKYIEVS